MHAVKAVCTVEKNCEFMTVKCRITENIDHTLLFELDDTCYDTRGHKYKLKKYRSRLDIRKY